MLRRLECVLAPTKNKVIEKHKDVKKKKEEEQYPFLRRVAKQDFYNTSKLTLATLSNTQTLKDIENYVSSFSKNSRDIFEYFRFMRY